jgi:hypothetical protein
LTIGISILDGDGFSLDVSKVAQTLPKSFNPIRNSGMGKSQQDSYAWELPRLLGLCPRPAHREGNDDCKKPRPFSILNFRFSIIG